MQEFPIAYRNFARKEYPEQIPEEVEQILKNVDMKFHELTLRVAEIFVN